MKNYQLVLLLILCLPCWDLLGQSEIKGGKKKTFGGSLTYLNNINPFNKEKHPEWTQNINAAINLSPSLYLGVSAFSIKSKNPRADGFKIKKHFEMINVFLQYDFIPQKKSRLFLETSLGTGNYCKCQGDKIAKKRKNTRHFGIGVGYNLPLDKENYLSLDLSTMSYHILDKIENRHPFFQYVIGIDINFIKNRKE